MNNSRAYNFRSIEFWKASIMTLPDNAFFELVRTVFGKVNTPFNKQILASDLEKFLLRADIQKNIANYIDRRDVRMIAAVAFLNEPCPSDLETFFAGELSYAELNDQLVNLEERFILYRFQDEDKSQGFKRLTLNPIFKSFLLPYIADTAMLFPSVHAGEIATEKSAPDKNQTDKNAEFPLLYDERIPAVLLSFVSMNEAFFNNKGGGIRQKVLNAAQTLFPSLPMETLIGGLQVLGLLFTKDDRLIPDYRRFSAFGRLNRQERAEYYTAGIFWYRESAPFKDGDSADFSDSGVSPWLMRTKVRFCATFIHRLCKMLDPDRLYSIMTLRKLAYALERENTEISIDKLVETMKQTGLLVSLSGEYLRKQSFVESSRGDGASALPAPTAPSERRAVIAMDASFSLMVYPEIEYNDLVKIAAFSHVTEAGLNVRFEINRDSAVSAFNMGIDADSIIELLQRLSQNRIDDNLIYALRDWEKSHREVTLRQGLVLTLAPERQYLAETRPLSTLITETLAPGIYMLPATLEERVVRALNKAGISIIARHGDHSDENRFPDGTRSEGYTSSFYPSFPSVNYNSVIFPNGTPPPNENPEGAPSGRDDRPSDAAWDLLQNFHSALKKMRFDKEKQDELEARIDRRLILCESQLKEAVLRYEKLEARGLDYNGKTLIAKQAISMQSLVEVVWPVNQKRERIFGIPKTLDKTGPESILVIKPIDGDEDTVRIPLGKISLLRRIKRSIFETNIV